jgi:hypothetical protein
MKSVIGLFALLMTSNLVFAVPRGNYLASPKKIEVRGDSVRLSFDLPCSNGHPEENAGNLIVLSDDEGDFAKALGVVLAKSSCEEGPLKTFVLKYPLRRTGLTQAALAQGEVFLVPINTVY